MNDHDKANLEFILSADKETLKDWYESLSDDEKLYAEELVKRGTVLVTIKHLEKLDTVTDTKDANIILDRFKL